ncbi:MAG: RCC1 repeat-containing protein, partial [Gemmatimonadota bacterium]|nr:RCC1 repeat-containing protein [Gemmatimonadota bacterium]
GRLGADTLAVPVNSSQPTPRAVFGGLTWSTIQTGWDFTCGLTTSGTAYCWGYNGDGNLGDGTFDQSPLRKAVNGGLTFATLSVGGYHTCGRVGASAVWCWGGGYDGQLGNGERFRRNEPVQIVQ